MTNKTKAWFWGNGSGLLNSCPGLHGALSTLYYVQSCIWLSCVCVSVWCHYTNLIPLTAHVILTPDNSPGNNNQVCGYKYYKSDQKILTNFNPGYSKFYTQKNPKHIHTQSW